MYRWLPPLAAALVAFALPAGASAQEYCVTCTGPDATYRCLIGGEASAAARSARGQFLCITELAKAGGHASCSAARGQATPCPGETRTVMFSLADPAGTTLGTATLPPASPSPPGTPLAPGEGLPPVALPPPGQPNAAPPTVPPPQDAAAPPKQTAVEEFATKTGKAVTDTGKAVGTAVKKSWDCVTSLFGNC